MKKQASSSGPPFEKPIDTYWQLKLERCKKAFEKNNLEVFITGGVKAAKAVFFNRILPEITVKTASWGDSITLVDSGILDAIRENHEIQFIETFNPKVSPLSYKTVFM